MHRDQNEQYVCPHLKSKSEIVIWIMKDISSNIGTTEAFATKEKNGHCTNHLELPEDRQNVLDLYFIRQLSVRKIGEQFQCL